MALNKTDMLTLIGANLPDNSTGAITPAKLREVTTQLADSMLYAAAGVKEVEILRAPSVANQQPTAVDTPLQVLFGSAQKAATDPVMLNAAGLVTFNATGTYAVRIKLQHSRTSATGISLMYSRILVNGVGYGSPQIVRIDNASATFITESRVVIAASAGTTLTAQIMRDSTGANSGGLVPFTPTVTAWGTAPSALLVISRLEPV